MSVNGLSPEGTLSIVSSKPSANSLGSIKNISSPCCFNTERKLSTSFLSPSSSCLLEGSFSPSAASCVGLLAAMSSANNVRSPTRQSVNSCRSSSRMPACECSGLLETVDCGDVPLPRICGTTQGSEGPAVPNKGSIDAFCNCRAAGASNM